MQCKLRPRALELVRNRPPSMTLKQLAQEAGVNLDWLKSFSSNRMKTPTVDNVERVYTYLSGKELEL